MYGLLGYIGVPFKSIAIFVLFLVCGLGVDDSFLMMHALRKLHDAEDTVSSKISRTTQYVSSE